MAARRRRWASLQESLAQRGHAPASVLVTLAQSIASKSLDMLPDRVAPDAEARDLVSRALAAEALSLLGAEERNEADYGNIVVDDQEDDEEDLVDVVDGDAVQALMDFIADAANES